MEKLTVDEIAALAIINNFGCDVVAKGIAHKNVTIMSYQQMKLKT